MADIALPVIRTPSELFDRVRAQWAPGHLRIIGVAGAPGAGKSTLVEALLDALRADMGDGASERLMHVPGDGFHLADAELARLGRLDRKGAPDTFDAAAYAALLRRIHESRDRSEVVYAPAFDRALEQPIAGSIAITEGCELVLTECNYLLLDAEPWDSVRAQLDEVWFVELDDAVRRARLVERHIRFGKSQQQARAWVRSVDEPNARLARQCRERADIVVELEIERSTPDA